MKPEDEDNFDRQRWAAEIAWKIDDQLRQTLKSHLEDYDGHFQLAVIEHLVATTTSTIVHSAGAKYAYEYLQNLARNIASDAAASQLAQEDAENLETVH